MLKFSVVFVLYLALDAVTAQSCSDTRKYAIRQDTSCKTYTQCINGQYQTQTCNSGLVFYEAAQQCVLANSYNCSTGGTQYSCPQPNGDFPHPTDCTRYLYCTNGNALVRNCPAGNVFDSTNLRCTFQNGNIPCQTNNNPGGNIYQCPSSYGKFPDPSDSTCTYYYNCNNYQGTRTQCQQNLLFHPGLSQCVTSDSYRCGGWNFNCPSSSGDFADPQNPNNYYYCTNGYPLRRYCPSGQVFNTALQRCSTQGSIVNGCSTISTPIQCNSGQSGNWSNPSDYTCRTYYQCQNYQQVQTTCSSNFVYYPGLQKCVIPDSYDCNSPNQFSCTQPNKDFPDPYNSRRYYYCLGLCPLHRTCPANQVYNGDPNVQRCQ